MSTKEYFVVFKNPDGVMTWTVYQGKEDFEKSRPELVAMGYAIVKEGVSEQEAQTTSDQTPAEAYIRAAMTQCVDPKTGQFVPELADHHAKMAAYAITGEVRI